MVRNMPTSAKEIPGPPFLRLHQRGGSSGERDMMMNWDEAESVAFRGEKEEEEEIICPPAAAMGTFIRISTKMDHRQQRWFVINFKVKANDR